MTYTYREQSHRRIAVWQEAVALAAQVDRLAAELPPTQRFGLGGRLRGAAGAIPVRIAAGHGCGHPIGYMIHLSSALESLSRLQLELIVMSRCGYLGSECAGRLDWQCGQVRRLLGCLAASLQVRPDGREAVAGSGRSDQQGRQLSVTSNVRDRPHL